LDLLGLLVPTEYGGAGADYRSYAIVVEEIGRACGSTGLSYYAAHASSAPIRLNFSAVTNRRKSICQNWPAAKWLGCWALTEPGTDPMPVRRKRPPNATANHWVLNGTKQFITNATDAHVSIIMAID